MLPLVEVLKRTESFLKERGIPSPRLEAELLLGHALQMKRLDLYMNFDRPLSDSELADLREPVRRRGTMEPMAYIVGEREFYSLSFAVGPGVLIPRPDTEALVEAALSFCEPAAEGEPVFVADIGTGSGCVGLTIAHEQPAVRLFATDVSREALDYARRNAESLKVKDRAALLLGDLLEPIPENRPIDVVVSNPPYIPSADVDALMPDVRDFEPRGALDGGADGLDIYRALIPIAAARARRAVVVEIGHDQGEAVAALFREAGLANVQVKQDLAGHDRVVQGERG